MRRTNYDGYDFANTGNILIYLKWTMMPHHKFWHKSWKEYLPQKKDSFFMQIVTEIDMPDDEDPELYWGKHLIGLINNKLIDWRSNFVSRLIA